MYARNAVIRHSCSSKGLMRQGDDVVDPVWLLSKFRELFRFGLRQATGMMFEAYDANAGQAIMSFHDGYFDTLHNR